MQLVEITCTKNIQSKYCCYRFVILRDVAVLQEMHCCMSLNVRNRNNMFVCFVCNVLLHDLTGKVLLRCKRGAFPAKAFTYIILTHTKRTQKK